MGTRRVESGKKGSRPSLAFVEKNERGIWILLAEASGTETAVLTACLFERVFAVAEIEAPGGALQPNNARPQTLSARQQALEC